ncbi:MAG: ankyrin repeat domain-containing protein [Caldilineaceae bacterium]
MNDAKKRQMGAMSLPLYACLDHRSRVNQDVAPLTPLPGTFEAFGGRPAIARIINGLYDRIETDSLLRPVFVHNLMDERAKLTSFFEAWLGGAPIYFNKVWPPGLAWVHAGLSISPGMANRWVEHFLAACGDVVTDLSLIEQIKPFVTRLAMMLVNRSDEPLPGEPLRGSTLNADPRFLHAVLHDDVASIAEFAKVQPQLLRRHGSRLLLLASVRGKRRAVEELLRQGVEVDMPSLLPGSEMTAHDLPMLPMTPLCGALAKGNEAIVKLLAEHGAQVDIFTAAFVGDCAAVHSLLEQAPELVNATDPASDVAEITPLLHAVSTGQLAVAQLLMQRGANVGKYSARLLQAAANRGHVALSDLLLDHGADPTMIGAGPWVLYPAIADKLVARGASVNHVPGAWIGLCCTGNSGHRENVALVRALLDYGADTAARYKGNSALHCAAKAGFVNVIEALLAHGADVNAPNDRGQTPLDEVERAGKSINREPVRCLLIANGAQHSTLLRMYETCRRIA